MEKKQETAKFKINLEEMAKAGVQFGHKPSKLHPRMEEYIWRKKGTVYLIDLEKTKEKLIEALEYIQGVCKAGGVVLFVGTKIQHKELVRETAEETGLPYVTERWLGGLLTNFKVIRDRVEYFKKFRKKINSEEFEKYSKKEQMDMKRELTNLESKFGGIEEMKSLPDVIFVCDLSKDELALREARKKDIPVIALCDTNVDPTYVDYPIPSNEDAVSSVRYILNRVKKAILEVRL